MASAKQPHDVRAILRRAAEEVAALIPDEDLLGETVVAGIPYRRHGIVTAVLVQLADAELGMAITSRWLEISQKRPHDHR